MVYKFKADNTDSGLNFDINLDVPIEGKGAVYCFIGKNGCGKTQLFKNLVNSILLNHSIHNYHPDIDVDVPKANYSILDIGKDALDFDKHITNVEMIMKDNFELNNQIYSDLALLKREIKHQFDIPVVYINSLRNQVISNPKRGETDSLENDETIFNKYLSELTNQIKHQNSNEENYLTDWIYVRALINPAFVDDYDQRLDEVKTLINLISELDNTEYRLNYSLKEGLIKLNNKRLDHLSSGYSTLLKLFQEIIAGLGAWLGVVGNDKITEQPAIVVIDEVETHLHAEWQYKLVPLLKKIFPKVYFYISTHSPLVVSSTEVNESYELIREGDKVTAKKLGDPKSWFFSDIINNAFHTDLSTNGRSENYQKISEFIEALSDDLLEFKESKNQDMLASINTKYDKLSGMLNEHDPRLLSIKAVKDSIL